MAWTDNLFGSSDKIIQSPTTTKSQQSLLDQILQLLGPALQNQQGFLQNGQQDPNLQFNYNPGANKFDFAPIEAEARQNFGRKTIPGIAERFTQMGGRGSSGFINQLGEAGSTLDTALASLKAKYGFLGNQQNNQNQLAAAQGQLQAGQFNQQQGFNNRNQQLTALQNLLGQGLAPQFQNNVQAGQAGLFPAAGQALAKALPYAASAYFGGPAAAAGVGASAITNYNQAQKAGII